MSETMEEKTIEIKTAYRFDAEGYFLELDSVMEDADGNILLPDDDTMIEPELTDGYWSKFNKSAQEWEQIKIPTTCAEAIEQNLSVISNSPKKHDREVFTLLQYLVSLESDDYRIKTDSDTLEMCIEAIPEKTFDEVLAEKESELSSIAGQFDSYKCDKMYITSSVGGYKFNADIRSQTNMQGLIAMLDATSTTQYKDYDNKFRQLNKAQLQTIYSECLQNGLNLYQQKFCYQSQLAACTTIEELNAITFDFTMMDFSNE